MSSLLFPGAAVGALLGGRLSDALGRKRTLLVCAGLFLVGALGCAMAPNVEIMVLARIVLGLGVGAAAVTCPLYLAEMAPWSARPDGHHQRTDDRHRSDARLLDQRPARSPHRGSDGVAVHAGHRVGARGSPAARHARAPGFTALVRVEGPPRRNPQDPRNEPQRVRAADEYASISFHAARDRKSKTSGAVHYLRDYPWMRRILWIGCGLAIVQQATGINTVNYYAPTILEQSGLGVSASLVATIAVGVTSVVMTILGIVLLGFVNRRKMLLTGFIGVASSQAALSLVFLLPSSTGRSYIILAAMMVFVAFVQCFVGTCVWLLLSEIFPMAIRGFAMGIAVFVLWTTNAFISFVFPILNSVLGSTGTFGLFVLVNLMSVYFVYRFVPETKGRSLEELEDRLGAGNPATSAAGNAAAVATH